MWHDFQKCNSYYSMKKIQIILDIENLGKYFE